MNNIKFILFSQKNSKLQFCQSDLLKLLSYLEGELQARDVVIAALKVIVCDFEWFVTRIEEKLTIFFSHFTKKIKNKNSRRS